MIHEKEPESERWESNSFGFIRAVEECVRERMVESRVEYQM